MIKKKYIEKNVYEAFEERLHFIFTEFDNIFVSFSGGKDSGLLLDLTLQFQKKHYPKKKKLVFFIKILKPSIRLRQNM